jgi:hypothetical protein
MQFESDGCETWLLTLREECRLRVDLESAVEENIGAEEEQGGENFIMRSSRSRTPHPPLCG